MSEVHGSFPLTNATNHPDKSSCRQQEPTRYKRERPSPVYSKTGGSSGKTPHLSRCERRHIFTVNFASMSAVLLATTAACPKPTVYRAPKGSPLSIDGDLTKPAWAFAPWSAAFGDIRGEDAPQDEKPPASCSTRMKMMWDDEFLYIGAEIVSDFAVVATFTERNSPIYQQDSDYEVFVDADGSCHNYKELEINALNVVWNLLLTRPYSDGGGEHSGRVAAPDEPAYYEAANQRSAVRIVSGEIGKAAGATWTVEIALAHEDTLARQPNAKRPAVGGRWRINVMHPPCRTLVHYSSSFISPSC